MYEIDAKFFNKDGSLDVEAACAAGRKARSRIIGEGASHMLSAASEAAGAVVDASGKYTLMTQRQTTK